jgi:LmbE family N-acetylglucosaminyl deacetylase
MKNSNRLFPIIVISLFFIFTVSLFFLKQNPPAVILKTEVMITPQDRVLILAPHPDDEVLGCAGIIQKAVAMQVPVRIVFLTYGDNNQWSFLLYRKHPVVIPNAVQAMGLVRYDEAIQADKILGVTKDQLTFLGYPDFKTLDIWYSHWGERPAAGSMLTEVKAVPYFNAFRPGALYKGEEILQDLKMILREFKPTKIFLSHPADHNPDHKSLYLFTRVALWDLESELKPELHPYIIHYANWPKPSGYIPEASLIPPELFQQSIPWHSISLTKPEVENKHSAIKKHRSQYDSSKQYLLSFIRSNELFGDFETVVLSPQLAPVVLTAKSKEDLAALPEQLIDTERESFVGIEKHSVFLENDNLVVTATLSRPLAETVGVSIYLFGYRSDKDFKDMPKLHIRFGAIEHNIFDQGRSLAKDIIKVVRKSKEITIRVPLQILGKPQRILISANTYLGMVPLDWVSWRVLELPKMGK